MQDLRKLVVVKVCDPMAESRKKDRIYCQRKESEENTRAEASLQGFQ